MSNEHRVNEYLMVCNATGVWYANVGRPHKAKGKIAWHNNNNKCIVVISAEFEYTPDVKLSKNLCVRLTAFCIIQHLLCGILL